MKQVPLSLVCDIKKWTSLVKKDTTLWSVPVIAGWKSPSCFHNISNRPWNIITVSASGANAGYVNYFSYPIFASDCTTIRSKDENIILTKCIYLFLLSFQEQIYDLQKWAGQPHVYGSDLEKIKIPLPSLEDQKSIVTKLNKLTELIDLKKEAIGKTEELTKSVFLEMFGNSMGWELKKLEDLLEDRKNLSYGIVQAWNETEGGVMVLRPVDIVNDVLYLNDVKRVSPEIEDKYAKTRLKGWEILLVVRWATWWVVVAPKECYWFNVTRGLAVIKTKDIDVRYLVYYLRSQEAQNYIREHTRWATLQQINLWDLREMPISVPPYKLQQKFALIEQNNQENINDQECSFQKLQQLYDSTVQEVFNF